jgi:CBS domain-containing protein
MLQTFKKGGLMNISEIMNNKPVQIPQNNTVKDAAKIMAEQGLSALPIVDDNEQLVGVISDSDFMGKEVEIPHAMASVREIFNENYRVHDLQELSMKVKDKELKEVMTKNPKTLTVDSTVNDVAEFMIKHNLDLVPIMEGSKLAGVVTRNDIVKAFAQ